MERTAGKVLKVIDMQMISHSDWSGEVAPEFEYRGRYCPKEMPKPMYDAFFDATKCGEKFYAYVLRKKVVKAVEIGCLTDLLALEGPYFGFQAITLLNEEDEAEGMGTAGDELGSQAGFFIPWSGYAARTLNALMIAAIEGTKEYDYYIDEFGFVRSPSERSALFCDCGYILDANQSDGATESEPLCERCASERLAHGEERD